MHRKNRFKLLQRKWKSQIPNWKISLISLSLAIVGALLSYFAIKLANHTTPPWISVIIFLLIVVTVLLSMIALSRGMLIVLGSIHWIYRKMLKTFGVKTIGIVISSQRCDDNEDVCQCGVYTYRDWLGWEHKFKFRRGMHWPSKEEWEKIMQKCSKGSQNPVYYFPILPFLHEMDFDYS